MNVINEINTIILIQHYTNILSFSLGKIVLVKQKHYFYETTFYKNNLQLISLVQF